MKKVITAARRRLVAQDGVAIVVAVGTLSVMLILSAFAFAAASALDESSSENRRERDAFQSAEAGLDVAMYRVNNLAPLNGGGCVPGVETQQTDGGCHAEGTLGDGSAWSYEVTPPLTPDNVDELLPGSSCGGYSIGFGDGDDATMQARCVTATGEIAGETSRVQARLTLFTVTDGDSDGATLFPVNGIVGLDGIRINNSGKIHGNVASNGLIQLHNASFVEGTATLGPGAPNVYLGNNSWVGEQGNPEVLYRSPSDGPWVLPPVDIGDTATVNNNGAWTAQGAQVDYDPDTRTIEFNNGKLTFHGGDYNFCDLYVKNSVDFDVTDGARVRLFIDSPEREGSGCPDGTGRFRVKNSFKVIAEEEQAQFQIYVYGGDVDGQPAVDIKNSSEFHALLYAPQATVLFKNSMRFYGAINARYVEFQNASDFWWPTDGIGDLTPDTDDPQNTSTLFQRSAWRECRPEPTIAGNVHSGC